MPRRQAIHLSGVFVMVIVTVVALVLYILLMTKKINNMKKISIRAQLLHDLIFFSVRGLAN